MVRSINFSTAVAFSVALFLFTFSNALAAPLSDPTNANASAISSGEIDLIWTDNSSKETGFRIERSLDGTNFTEVATVGKNVEAFSDSSLDSNTTYFYKVRAYKVKRNSTNYSGYTNVANDSTFETAPVAPSTNVATALSSNQIKIDWLDNSDNEESFTIERSLDGTNFNIISTTTADTETYTDFGLSSETTYYYRVLASNYIGDSAYTNTADATTFDVIPAAPTSLSIFATTSALSLYWTDNSDNEDTFEIERGTDGVNFSFLNTSTIPYYTDSFLSSSTTFYYRVRAVNATGNSTYTNTAFGTAL